MENRLPRSKARSPQPSPTAHEEEALEGQDPRSSEAEFRSMGSTRVVGLDALASSEKTHSPDDTAVPSKGEATDNEITVLGDFELLKKLGEGAMGEVWKARQISFDREVALKVLFPHVANNPKLVERLTREGRAMGLLDHPNIIVAYDVGEAEGYHYVAMEFVDGDTLQKWLGRLQRFNIPDALAITLACARGLEYAHQQNMVHRDIKPDNVLIDRRGTVKVADLGMVKSLDEDMSLTQTGHAVGTPWYMPMEQAKNAKDVDGRCDIYALGCMLYCLLTGDPPFTGRTLVDVIQAKQRGTFTPARKLNPEVPERLDLILLKMTAKEARDRYQNCAEVIKDLESLGLAADKLSFLQAKPAKPTTNLEITKPDSTPEAVTNEWFVRFKREGEISVRKLTTIQVKKMLEEGTIDPTAKASQQPKVGFRALATFKEFQGTALVKQAKKVADKESAKYRNLYKKIEENERKRDQEEKKYDAPSYYSSLWAPGILIIGALTGAIALIYLLMWLFS
jgi:serine/threonine protein kinase